MGEADEPVHGEVAMRLLDAVGPVDRQLVNYPSFTEAKVQVGVML